MLLNLRVGSQHKTALCIQDNKEIDTIRDEIADRETANRDQAAQKVFIAPGNCQRKHCPFHRILLNPGLHLLASGVVCQSDLKLAH